MKKRGEGMLDSFQIFNLLLIRIFQIAAFHCKQQEVIIKFIRIRSFNKKGLWCLLFAHICSRTSAESMGSQWIQLFRQKTAEICSFLLKWRVWLVWDSLGRSEQVAAVGGDAVDGTLVTLQLPQSPQSVRVPQLEHPASAAAQQGRRAGDDAQSTDPVTMGVRDLLSERRIVVFLKYCHL